MAEDRVEVSKPAQVGTGPGPTQPLKRPRVAEALIVPPLTSATLIVAAWILHVWEVGPSTLGTVVAWGGMAWALTMAFRFAEGMERGATAALFVCLMVVILFVGGIALDCFLWTISDGGCL